MERTWGNLVIPTVVGGGELGGCRGGVVNLCPGDFENGLAGVRVIGFTTNPGSFSGKDKMDETVVDEVALEEVDENE